MALIDPNPGPVASYNTGSWNTAAVREHGAVLYDPATSTWVCAYSGQAGTTEKIGLTTSATGVIWTEASNPITGSTEGEDPYIAKNVDGTVYRDASDRALLFCENRVASAHNGIDLWRSTANTLTGWTRYGQVVGPGAGWDATDRTSPVVIFDGTQLVMLFEGRSPTNEGEIGYATSIDEGETWTVASLPIVTRGGSGTWNDTSLVPDDLIKVGSEWILLVHGSTDGLTFNAIGRYSTTDAPSTWDNTSFAAMTGNPIDTVTETLMCWGNDPTLGLMLDTDRRHILKVAIVES